ncbi:unnamed protein product [Toxocara canis]|uniref:Transmembrane protein n=1 Tax=Toxocara canis TaxID=6265 RepID=A0A183VF37_TOXCA|nr:unnamed protein product [Toxocara canis]
MVCLQEIVKELRSLESFSVDETNRYQVAEPLSHALDSLVSVLMDDKTINGKRMSELCGALFVHYDLYILFLKRIISKIVDLQGDAPKWNVFRCLKYFPLPNNKCWPAFFEVEGNHLKPGPGNKKLKRLYQEAWLGLLKHEQLGNVAECETIEFQLPRSLLKQLVPYLGDRVLSALRDASLTGDFLFGVFRLGGVFAILSLSAIFRLIMEHNFEYPNFSCEFFLVRLLHMLGQPSQISWLQIVDSDVRLAADDGISSE